MIFKNIGPFSYLQSLEEVFKILRPATLREKRVLEVALKNLKEVAGSIRRLVSENESLKEQAKILEEERDRFKKKYVLLKLEVK